MEVNLLAELSWKTKEAARLATALGRGLRHDWGVDS